MPWLYINVETDFFFLQFREGIWKSVSSPTCMGWRWPLTDCLALCIRPYLSTLNLKWLGRVKLNAGTKCFRLWELDISCWDGKTEVLMKGMRLYKTHYMVRTFRNTWLNHMVFFWAEAQGPHMEIPIFF